MEKMLDQTGVKLSSELKTEIEEKIKQFAPRMTVPGYLRMSAKIVNKLLETHGPLAVLNEMLDSGEDS